MNKNKKHWYDYLWIVSAVYLILGFVNILFAWLGLLCFFYSFDYFGNGTRKSILQPLLRQRSAILACRRKVRIIPKKGCATVDEIKMVPLRVTDFLLRHVRTNVVEHIFGFCRSTVTARGD